MHVCIHGYAELLHICMRASMDMRSYCTYACVHPWICGATAHMHACIHGYAELLHICMRVSMDMRSTAHMHACIHGYAELLHICMRASMDMRSYCMLCLVNSVELGTSNDGV